MSVNATSTFGMKHNSKNTDLKKQFDDQFEYFDGLDTASIPSWGCTGSCVCCSNGCNSCF